MLVVGSWNTEEKVNPVCYLNTSEQNLLNNCQFSNRYYSMYGHFGKLAEEIKKGASSVEGVEAKTWQVSPDHE
jgi:hypothetical protein